ncbi:MAG: flagellin FliC [Magnetococcales bacterium]|nr:flagellin FliC [Magnetococcales bacterium]
MTISFSSSFLTSMVRRNISTSSKALSGNLMRISSGLRLNSAADGAADLSVADSLSTEIRGLAVATRNTNDGISLTQVAEAALVETTNALQGIREFALVAQNATVSSADRQTLQTEVNSLLSEIARIATQTEFNSLRLLAGSFDAMQFMIGTGSGDVIDITLSGASYGDLGLGTDASEILVSTDTQASTTVTAIDTALDRVSAIRSQLGGAQSRFSSIINQIEATTTALDTARSNIMDADIALETAALTRNSILQQAGIAVMAQANLQPKIFLQLLNQNQ